MAPDLLLITLGIGKRNMKYSGMFDNVILINVSPVPFIDMTGSTLSASSQFALQLCPKFPLIYLWPQVVAQGMWLEECPSYNLLLMPIIFLIALALLGSINSC